MKENRFKIKSNDIFFGKVVREKEVQGLEERNKEGSNEEARVGEVSRVQVRGVETCVGEVSGIQVKVFFFHCQILSTRQR